MSRYQQEKEKWDREYMVLLDESRLRGMDVDAEGAFAGRNTLRPARDFLGDLMHEEALDYGCGSGWTTLLLAQLARQVCCFDISSTSVQVVKRAAEVHGLSNVRACVADGEHLPYGDDRFDVVFGNAVLHHIRLDQALAEIARVLKPGGRAAFCEPFAHNPLVNLYRYVKHHLVDDYEGTDQPLRYDDKRIFERYFGHVEFVESSFIRDRIAALRPVESLLLEVPALRRFVCYVTVLLGEPRKEASEPRLDS